MIILAISLLIIPLIVWLFSKSGYIITTGTDLDKSDWLSFLGSYLSCLGTIFLGLIALWQNQRLFSANKRLVELGTKAQFYSEIEPAYFEIEKKKLDRPFDMMLMKTLYSQQLVKHEESIENEITGLWHVRFFFKKIRSFALNSYNIESCEIYLDNKNGETQKSIIEHCAPEDKGKPFKLANKSDIHLKGYVIMSVAFTSQENDDKIWKEFIKARKLNMNLKFKYRNSFNVEANSSIRITWSNPQDENRYKQFKTNEYFVYETEHILIQDNIEGY